MPAGRGTKKKKKKKEKAPEYDINDIVEVETEIDEARVQKVLKEPEGSSNNIRVAVRIRPPNQRELDCGASNIVVSKHGLQVMVGTCKEDTQAFTYDVVLMNCTQIEAFDDVGLNIVQAAFHGFNATCFAYGQTSSGKSYRLVCLRKGLKPVWK